MQTPTITYWGLFAIHATKGERLHSIHSLRGSALASQQRARSMDEDGWHADYTVRAVPREDLPKVLGFAA